MTVPVPVDRASLRALAESTGGTAFTATSAGELTKVYADIGSQVGFTTEQRPVTDRVVGVALAVALLTALASLAWFARLP